MGFFKKWLLHNSITAFFNLCKLHCFTIGCCCAIQQLAIFAGINIRMASIESVLSFMSE